MIYIRYKKDKLRGISMSLQTIFSFIGEGYRIVELKRIDIDESSPPELKFYWLKYDQKKYNVERLDFVSKNTFDDYEYRKFKQGSLKFNDFHAFYENQDEHLKLILERSKNDTLEPAILNFFAEL